ncbi:MAG TPA: antibiotic biosynthesis monooxygenase [Thermodesulfovibrionales bacterium]|nr:antibiotic biosynthesis monooxygenase [Thermodesulfovibrionales bacterium]
MNARVAVFNIKSGKREEAIHLFKNFVVPEAHKQKGFKGGLLLTNPDTGQGMSIGLWETEADMTATERSGFYQKWVSRFTDFFTAPPSMEHYEVNIKDY